MKNPAQIIETALWAAIALAAVYLVRRFQAGLDVASDTYTAARDRTANLIETFFPLVSPNSMVTYAVTFPDGSRHAVNGETVERGGFFLYGGARYRLMTSASGQKIAVAV